MGTRAQKLVSGSEDGSLRLWNIGSRESKTFFHNCSVKSVCMSLDEQSVTAGCRDGSIRIWNVSTGAARVLLGHNEPISCVNFTADFKRLISGSLDGSVRLWDKDIAFEFNEAKVKNYHLYGIKLYFSSNGQMLVFPQAKKVKDRDIINEREWELPIEDLDDHVYYRSRNIFISENGQRIIFICKDSIKVLYLETATLKTITNRDYSLDFF